MRLSRRAGYAVAALALIAIGLLTRWPAIAWPAGVAKYLGSALWGAMVFCAVGVCWPRQSLVRIALAAFLVAAATEFSQLWHTEVLDAFRRTTIGVLLIGRYFAWGDIVAYAVGITIAGIVAKYSARNPN